MIKGVIFDLDGVLVSTDEMHFEAWNSIAAEENIYFDKKINDRLRGVSRLESLNIVLEKSNKDYNLEQKKVLAERKNLLYREYISQLNGNDILSGVIDVLNELKKRALKTAVGSSSKNADLIVKKTGLDKYLDIVVSGKDTKKSKPDPEIFLLAAKKMKLDPEQCVVIEDAESGVEAAKAAGMKIIGVGNRDTLRNVDTVISGLDEPEAISSILY